MKTKTYRAAATATIAAKRLSRLRSDALLVIINPDHPEQGEKYALVTEGDYYNHYGGTATIVAVFSDRKRID